MVGVERSSAHFEAWPWRHGTLQNICKCLYVLLFKCLSSELIAGSGPNNQSVESQSILEDTTFKESLWVTAALMQPGGLHVLSTLHGDRCPVLAEAPAHPHCTGKGGSFLQLWANGSMSLNTTLWAGKRGHLERVVNFCYSPGDLCWYMSMWFAHSCKKEQPLSVKWGWAGASAIEQKGWNLNK